MGVEPVQSRERAKVHSGDVAGPREFLANNRFVIQMFRLGEGVARKKSRIAPKMDAPSW